MREISVGEKRAITEVCNTWLMTIVEIVGGINNISRDEIKKIMDLQDLCVKKFKEYIEQNETVSNDTAFWLTWREEHPEFYDFEQYRKYNPDNSKAQIAIEKAIQRFS